MDLFNQPKEFDYKTMNHKLKLEERLIILHKKELREFVLTSKKSTVQKMLT